MKKILITGAHSFIGSYFIKASEMYEVEEVDLEHVSFDNIDFKGFDVVFHVAAIVHQDASISDQKYLEVNRDLAYNVAKAAKSQGVSQFVFMSTVKVYGENSTEEDPWTELSECFPQDAYGKSKLAAEQLIGALASDAFAVSIIRTPVVYGCGVKGNIALIGRFISKFRILPLGGIKNKRAMIYIGNLIYIIQIVIEKKYSGVALASENEGYSTSQFVNYLADASKKRIFILPLPHFVIGLIKQLKPGLYDRLFGSMVLCNDKTVAVLDLQLPYKAPYGFNEVMNGIEKE